MLTALDKAPPPITSHRAMVQERWIKEAAEAASYQGVCAAFAIKIGVRLLHRQNAERGRAQSQERMASIAWAIKIAALTVMKKATSSQVITFVSSNGVERAHSRTVKNSGRDFSISVTG